MTTTEQDSQTVAAAKIAGVWAGTLFGAKLSDIVLIATLVYTVFQIVIHMPQFVEALRKIWASVIGRFRR